MNSINADFDVQRIRRDFPILTRQIDGKPLIYFDNAATSLKPKAVIDAVSHFYTESCANIHRGVHLLSSEASELFEEARQNVASFLNADEEEIVFVRNATEAINLVAHSFTIKGSVATTLADHHSAMLPWLAGFDLKYVNLDKDGSISISSYKKTLQSGVGFVCIPHVSNALGIVSPVASMTAWAHEAGAFVMVDGSQSVPHLPTDVRELDCDFLVFSGHKMLAPSGIGVLFGKRELLEQMPPFLTGGDMNKEVHQGRYIAADLPTKFEAGTPNIEGAIGLGAAVDYLDTIGMHRVEAYCEELTRFAFDELGKIDRLRIYGPLDPNRRSSSIAFELDGLEAHGLAKMLSQRYAIMVRSGYHCAQPLHEAIHLPQTVRASFYLYNTPQEIERLAAALQEISRYYTTGTVAAGSVYTKDNR